MLQNRRKQHEHFIDKENDRIYYNISIVGTSSTFNSNFFNLVPAIYQEQLNQSIINCPCDYYMTITRFTIPTNIVPIFIFIPQPYPNTDKDLGIYSFTLEYNGIFSPQTFVKFISSNPTAEKPIKVSASNPVWSRGVYYYVYNYIDYIVMINNTLKTAFNDLPSKPAGSTAPFITFDASTQLLSLLGDAAFYNQTLATPINIYFNTYTQKFFDGLPYVFNSAYDPLGRDCKFTILDTYDNSYLLPNKPPPSTGSFYLRMIQNYNTLSNWNSFKSLQIITNLIPIKNEYVPSSQQSDNNAGIVNLLGVVSDFEPILYQGAESRTSLQYQQIGPYRLIDMTDLNPLSKLDISVYWTDELLNRYLLYIGDGLLLTLKIAFIKKSTYFG